MHKVHIQLQKPKTALETVATEYKIVATIDNIIEFLLLCPSKISEIIVGTIKYISGETIKLYITSLKLPPFNVPAPPSPEVAIKRIAHQE